MIANNEIIMNAISNLGFEVFRNGQFHWNSSNTPDMYINQDGTIHCWTSSPFKNNTNNHGDLIDFLQMTNVNQTFKEAKKEAEKLTGLTLPSLDSYKDNGYTIDNTNRKTGFIGEEFIKNFDVSRVNNFERYKELLNQALPSLEFAKQKEIALKYQIGYIAMSDRLSMPIKDEENRIVTLWKYNKNPNNYINDKGIEVTPSKVLFTKGRDRCPFNLYDIQKYREDMNQEIFLCGGEKDTLNMIGNGYRAITLGSENENLKDKYKPLFQDLKIVIAYDNDKAGKDGANKILNQLQGIAKEVNIWNWDNIKKEQRLSLNKGFDMTDYLVEIKKLNIEFNKTNYINNKQKDVKMKNYYQVQIKNKNVHVELEPTKNDKNEIKNYFKDEIQNIKQLSKEEYDSIANKRHHEITPIYLFARYKTKNNEALLTILEEQASEYKDILGSERKSSEIKLNSDFLKNQVKEKNELDSKTSNEKPIFISKKIDNLKEIGSQIKNKVIDFQINKFSKDELFKDLEKQIAEFEAMIQQLKEENKILRKELELLVEQQQKESEKNNLTKENMTLKEKIEVYKNKHITPFDEKKEEKKPLKINKITYESNNEREI